MKLKSMAATVLATLLALPAQAHTDTSVPHANPHGMEIVIAAMVFCALAFLSAYRRQDPDRPWFRGHASKNF